MQTVIFRVDKEGAVYALFPNLFENRTGSLCTSYQHVGQHSAADYNACIANSRPANPKEFEGLATELRGRGYELKIRRRWSRPYHYVECSVCNLPTSARSAHKHHGLSIGDECCWDDKLKAFA